MRRIIRKLSLLALIFIIQFGNIAMYNASEYWTVENIDSMLESEQSYRSFVQSLEAEGGNLKADKPELYYYTKGMTNIIANDLDAAFFNLKEAAIQGMAKKDVKVETAAIKKLIWICDFYGKSGELIDYGTRLIELADRQQSIELELYAYNAIALSYFHIANDEKAIEYLNRMLHLAEELDRKDYKGIYNASMGHISYSYMDYKASLNYYEKALDSFKESRPDNVLLDMRALDEARIILIKSKEGIGNRGADLARMDVLIREAEKSHYNTMTLYSLYLAKGQIEKEYSLFSMAVESYKRSMELLNRVKHVDSSANIGAFVEVSLADAYYKNGNYREAAALYASISENSQDPDYFKDIDKASSKLRTFEEEELNSRIELLTDLQEAQDKKIQYQRSILVLLAFIIAILIWAFAMITRENEKVNRLKNNLYTQSITDALTGVLNRRKIWENLDSEEGGGNIIALVDVDNFKQINDTYGHLAGDEVLKKVVASIKSSVREKDEIGRYGGEEFIIILKDTDLNNAIKVMERVREKVYELDWDYENLKTSISIGIANRNNLKAEAIFKVVDTLLQEAKQHGKNRVVFRRL